jgi:sulfatase modifying factor 1
MRFPLLLILLLAGSLLTSAARGKAAVSPEPRSLLDQKWDRELADVGSGGDKVDVELALLAGTDALGKRALFVDLTSEAGDNAAALLNGAVLVALPLGVELDGKPRLYWVDTVGKPQYAYSMDIPGAGAPAALDRSPLEQLRSLGEASLAIDPALAIVTPADPRITDKALSLTWRLPATVQHKALVDPFDVPKGMGKATRLRAIFPLKGSGDLPIAVYVGALSCVGLEIAQAVLDNSGALAPAINSEWISWEGEVSPADVLGSLPSAKADSRDLGDKPSTKPASSDAPKKALTEQSEPVAPTSSDAVIDVAPGDDAPPQSAPLPSRTTSKEVTPGTLALEPEVYRVPLKPITGSGAGATFTAPNVAASPVGPSQLSPQAGATLAAPASEMVLVPAGPFEMGTAAAPLDDRADEAPQHSVDLPAYYIDKLPVTNRQYYNFVISSGYKPEGAWQKYYEPATADLPVSGVSWNDAAAYARWAGKRLPSEAEWEKAARGTDARTYPWGEDWSSEIIPRSDNYYGLVGSPKIASPYGVLATCGILWQWTGSNYAAYPFNPKAGGDKKVLRGGCFSNGRNIVRCANRYAEPPGVALNTFTFRCAKDA